ncbi:hypothetical protein SAMN02800694_3470 [Luteibacter sp. UNCMF331Sha3.1]|uniref:hypothetical protein n=1 Tax=Luteibacter sp. UNCMF331Sha3.1 TaxID=1502760 RepID=UPI0008C03B5F|nr:hypothetical protein [Luteibacter sp. UNCMF331Sha3.1]SEN43241.1 hypothetical protein SAMN02800694_3470 [Luteibacter sp. UNCMF331Sha3.1]
MNRTLFYSAFVAALLPLTAYAREAAPPETTPATAPALPGCAPMEIGPVYDASLSVGSTLGCFQFVTPETPAATKVDVNLAGFRAGELHDVSLVRVDSDGSTHAAATDASMDAYRVLQSISNSSTRWLLLVGRPKGGDASPFQMQVTLSTGVDRHEPNDAFTTTTKLEGNQRIEGNLDNAGDVDNFLISFRPDQKTANLELEAPAGVVGIVVDGAKKTGELRGGSAYRVDSSRPVFVQVKGDASTVGARYTIALRDPGAAAVVTMVRSKENISHLAPGLDSTVPGGANVARVADVEAKVFEGDRATPVGAGYVVRFKGYDVGTNGHWLLTEVTAVTDEQGVARTALKIGPCRGGAIGPITVPTRGNPPDFWDIEYNPSGVVIATVDGGAPSAKHGELPFEHICKETFRMHRPWKP